MCNTTAAVLHHGLNTLREAWRNPITSSCPDTRDLRNREIDTAQESKGSSVMGQERREHFTPTKASILIFESGSEIGRPKLGRRIRRSERKYVAA